MTYRPDSKLLPEARVEIAKLQNQFAIKNYDNGMYYFRDKAYDSAILYFKEVLENWPAPKAKDAGLRLVEAYRAIRYTGRRQRRVRGPSDEVSERSRSWKKLSGAGRECHQARALGARKPPIAGDRTAEGRGRAFGHDGWQLRSAASWSPACRRRRAMRLSVSMPWSSFRRPYSRSRWGVPRQRRMQRIDMVRRLVGDDSRFSVDAVEVERGGLSFSVDTVTALRRPFPPPSCSSGRGGCGGKFGIVARARANRPASHARRRPAWRRPGGWSSGDQSERPHVLATRRIDVSSTEVRERVRAGKSIHGFVPDAVADTSRRTGLYR